jgi:hypothetical protein
VLVEGEDLNVRASGFARRGMRVGRHEQRSIEKFEAGLIGK